MKYVKCSKNLAHTKYYTNLNNYKIIVMWQMLYKVQKIEQRVKNKLNIIDDILTHRKPCI